MFVCFRFRMTPKQTKHHKANAFATNKPKLVTVYGRHRRHKIKHGITYYPNIFAIIVLILHIFIHRGNVNNVWFYTFAALAHLAEINSRRNVRI